jgi:hypothetical protein
VSDRRLSRVGGPVGKGVDPRANAAKCDQLAASEVEDPEHQVLRLGVTDDWTEEAFGRGAVAAGGGGGDPSRVGGSSQLLQPVILQGRQPIVGAQRVLDEAVVSGAFGRAADLGTDDRDANHANEEDEHDERQNDAPPE